MARPRPPEAVPSSTSPSPQPPLLPQHPKLLCCRAPLCDVAVCAAVAAVAGVDIYLVSSSSSGAAASAAAGRAAVNAQELRSPEASVTETAAAAAAAGEKPPARAARAQPRLAAAAEGISSSVTPSTLSGVATDSDTCVLLTEKGSIRSAYAICLYLTSQAATEQARETLLPSSTEVTPEQQLQQGACQNTNTTDIAVEAAAATKKRWLVENWLAWAAFTFRAAVRGVRKDVLLRQLDYLEQHIESSPAFAGLALPAMFVSTALRYSFPGSTFSDWPAISKWLTSVCASPVFEAAARLVSPSTLITQSREIRRAELLSPRWGATAIPQQQKRRDTPLVETQSSGHPKKSGDSGEQPGGKERETYYLTTAINYTNGPPHMGHVYEAVAADVIARYHRVYGRDVYFLTGSDEHGQKIANTAAALGKQPLEICDLYVEKFKALNKLLSISNDFYIRTTMPEHKKVCHWMWDRVKANGDIYLHTYRGWYNEREETFVSEQEARAADYKDPVSGKPLQQMEEPSYFFRMSKYQSRLIEHIKSNPNFILPEKRRNHILKRLEEPLLDLSCSRNTFSWGVHVPGDPSHVMYVWFDALTNYISALSPPDGEKFHKYWPANLQLIGKDIVWFHTVIWPCMLMSASLPLPKSVFGHGFVLAADGEKMSKSLGNVVDPHDILKEYDSDSFRYYLMKEARFGGDLRFEKEGLTACQNADLADTLGNLVHRALSLCVKFCDGVVPDVPLPGPTGLPPFSIPAVVSEVETYMKQLMLRETLEVAMDACRNANKFLTDWAPWSLPNRVEQQQVVRAALEAVYVVAHLLEPFIPVAAAQIFEKLSTGKRTLSTLSPWFDNLAPGTRVHVGGILFTKIMDRTAELAFQKCEIRIGRVAKAQPHPQFSKDPTIPPYLVLHVVFSDEKTGADPQQKTAVVLLDQNLRENPQLLLNRRVLAVCNIKPVSIKGVVSQVMVLAAAKNGSKLGDAAAAEGELLQVAEEEAGDDGGAALGTTKRDDVVDMARETEETVKRSCSNNTCARLGALVEAAGYPPVLKNRENVRTAEMQAMEFIVQKDRSILLNGKFALRVGQSGSAVLCGKQTQAGNLVLV